MSITDVPDFYKLVGNHVTNASLSGVVTISVPAGASWLLIQATGANVRYKLDNGTPSASAGFQLKSGNPPIRIPVTVGWTIKMIQESSGAAIEYQFLG